MALAVVVVNGTAGTPAVPLVTLRQLRRPG